MWYNLFVVRNAKQDFQDLQDLQDLEGESRYRQRRFRITQRDVQLRTTYPNALRQDKKPQFTSFPIIWEKEIEREDRRRTHQSGRWGVCRLQTPSRRCAVVCSRVYGWGMMVFSVVRKAFGYVVWCSDTFGLSARFAPGQKRSRKGVFTCVSSQRYPRQNA